MQRQSLRLLLLATFVALASLVGCKKKEEAPSKEAASTSQPTKIKVQHILISFGDRLPGQKIQRTQEEAKKLAEDLLAKAKADGANFEAMVREFSADGPPGIYELTNFGAAREEGAFPRDQMVPAFGDVGFALNVGEVGLADFDLSKSPYGYHIIKRLN